MLGVRLRKIFLLVAFLSVFELNAQMTLTLDECIDMALKENTKIKINEENALSAKYARKSVLANFFPRFSANGGYMYNSSHAYILPDQLNTSLGTIGIDGVHLNSSFLSQNLPNLGNGVSRLGAHLYQYVYDLFDVDMTHVFVGQVGVIQPIWFGGRIIQSYKLAKSLERVAAISGAKNRIEMQVEVEEAYWRVASVQQKVVLANQYVDLLQHLLSDVTEAEVEGMSTKSDVLRVQVKLNEAEASQAKAVDGLALSKMALCQIIGLPLKTDINVDTNALTKSMLGVDTLFLNNMDEAVEKRKEIQLLEEAQKMAKTGVKLVSAGLQPNIVASANFITTNPNVHNSFDKHFYGFFNVGVVVNVPIAHADAILALKASKHKAKTVNLQLQEAKEKIQLQMTQSYQKWVEANKHLIRANTSVGHAQENLRYAQAAYEEGLITMSDLMMAQTAWQQAEADRIDACIEVKMAEITQRKNSGNIQ